MYWLFGRIAFVLELQFWGFQQDQESFKGYFCWLIARTSLVDGVIRLSLCILRISSKMSRVNIS